MITELHTYVFEATRRDSGPASSFSDYKIEVEAHTAADALVIFQTNAEAEADMSIPRREYRLRRMWLKKEGIK